MTDTKHLIGQILGERYRLVRWIGGGGFADVYEAEDLKFVNERAAVKILKPEFAKRVAVEAKIGRKFKHPNVVAITDMNVDGKIPYIVMDYLEGRTVDHLRPLSVLLLRKFVREICEALQHAHESGLVHRDLKLQNIMLVDPGTAREHFKILDFGIAAQVNAGMTLRNATMDGGGTIEYMPPEHLCSRGVEPSPGTDIYAIGVILYELLMGRKPFQADGQSIMETLRRIESEPPPRFCEIDRDCQIDSAVESLVLQCLSKSPERRPETVKEIAIRFLESYGVDEAGNVNESSPTDWSKVILPPASPFQRAPLSDPPLLMNLDMPPLEQQAPIRPVNVTMPPPIQSAPEWDKSRPPGQYPAAGNVTMVPPSADYSVAPSKPVSSWDPSGTMQPGGQRLNVTRPPQPLPREVPASRESHRGRSTWVRSSAILVVVLLLLVASALIAIQRQSALAKIEQDVAAQHWGQAVLNLESGNFFSYPFVNRAELIDNLNGRWIQEIQTLMQQKKLRPAVDECGKLNDSFPDDPQAAEILKRIAEQTQSKIREFIAADDYVEAVACFTGSSVGARVNKVNRKLLDPTRERVQILNAGLAKFKALSQQKKYAAVIKGGRNLQAEFPNDPALQSLLHRAEVSVLLEAGNRKLTELQFDAAIADYSMGIALKPDPAPDQWRELHLKRATANHRVAAAKLADASKAQELKPAEAELVLQPVNLMFSDLREILTRDMQDPEARKLRSQAFLLRAGLYRKQNDLPRAVCNFKLALTDDPNQRSALEAVTAICAEQGEIGLQHYSKAHDLTTRHAQIEEGTANDSGLGKAGDPSSDIVKLSLEMEQEWQLAIDHLSLAILSCEAGAVRPGVPVDNHVLPLYYSRADARYRQAKPDYEGAIDDLKSFEKLAATVQKSDAQWNLNCVQAPALLAWIQATCDDPKHRNPAEAKLAAASAYSLFESTYGKGKLDKSQTRLKSYVVQAFAAAEARNGHFDEAIGKTEEERANLDPKSEEWALHSRLLKLYYNEGKPYTIEPTREQSASKTFADCVAE